MNTFNNDNPTMFHKTLDDLLQTDAVNGDTTALLVNAIYFITKLLYPFSKEYTMKAPFYMNNKQQTEVEMMNTKDWFGYAELPALKAKAFETPYKDSNISMLIILPNARDGLKTLERKLKILDFNEILSKIVSEEMRLVLPKFRIEYDVDLKEPLKQVGLKRMFDEIANLSGFLIPHNST